MFANLFTIEFNILNLLITVAGISGTYAAIYFIYPKFLEQLKEKLVNSFNRLAADSTMQPLYDVFLGFNHQSTAAWVNWLKNEDPKIQKKAFKRLKDYLDESPCELGLVTAEVVEAVVLLENEESFSTLENLIENTKTKYSQYKSVEGFFSKACYGMKEINPSKAKEKLHYVLDGLKSNLDHSKACKHVIDAVSQTYEPDDSLSQIIDTIIDNEHSYDTRQYLLKKICENDDHTRNVLIETFDQQIKHYANHKPSFDDQSMLALVINLLLELEDDNGQIWQMIVSATKKDNISEILASALQDIIPHEDCKLSSAQCLELLSINEPALRIIEKALIKRFKITEAEEKCFENLDYGPNLNYDEEYSYFEKLNLLKFDMNVINKDLQKLQEKLFPAETKTKVPGLMLLLGHNFIDKVEFCRIFAANNDYNFVYFDTDVIFKSPDKLEELLNKIESKGSCLIFLDNIAEILKEIHEGSAKRRLVSALKTFHDLSAKKNLSIVANLNLVKADLGDLKDYVTAIPNESFKSIFELKHINNKDREKIFYSYESKFASNRDFGQIDVENLISYTEGLSTIEFINYARDFFKSELLSKGSFANIEED